MSDSLWMSDYNQLILRVIGWAVERYIQYGSVEVLNLATVDVYSGTEITSKNLITGQTILRAFEVKSSTVIGLEQCFPSTIEGVKRVCKNTHLKVLLVRATYMAEDTYFAVSKDQVVQLYR